MQKRLRSSVESAVTNHGRSSRFRSKGLRSFLDQATPHRHALLISVARPLTDHSRSVAFTEAKHTCESVCIHTALLLCVWAGATRVASADARRVWAAEGRPDGDRSRPDLTPWSAQDRRRALGFVPSLLPFQLDGRRTVSRTSSRTVAARGRSTNSSAGAHPRERAAGPFPRQMTVHLPETSSLAIGAKAEPNGDRFGSD